MKKSIIVAAFIGLSVFSFAENSDKYKLNDAAVDQLFAQSEDISVAMSSDISSFANVNAAGVTVNGGGQNVGGYLIRSFFCGFIALHRSYMGTGGATLWWMYFCIPVVGGVVGFVDFWWVVFMGEDAMKQYSNNSKFVVWLR